MKKKSKCHHVILCDLRILFFLLLLRRRRRRRCRHRRCRFFGLRNSGISVLNEKREFLYLAKKGLPSLGKIVFFQNLAIFAILAILQ